MPEPSMTRMSYPCLPEHPHRKVLLCFCLRTTDLGTQSWRSTYSQSGSFSCLLAHFAGLSFIIIRHWKPEALVKALAQVPVVLNGEGTVAAVSGSLHRSTAAQGCSSA